MFTGGSDVTITHDDLITLVPLPVSPLNMRPYYIGTPTLSVMVSLDLFKLVDYEAHTIGKYAVHTLLECFLVQFSS